MDSDAIVCEYEDFCQAVRALNIPDVEMNDMSYTANDFTSSDDFKEQDSSGEREAVDKVQLPAKKDQYSLIVLLRALYEQ